MPVNYAGHGYGAIFASSIYDRYWHPNITQDEAYEVFKKCIVEIQKRLVVNLKNFTVAVVDKDGVRNLEPISSSSLAA